LLLWDGRPARPKKTGGTPIPQTCESYLILIPKFYDNLRSPMSKAEALQEAQKALINQNKKIHPAQWAPFILIGNWL